MILIDAHEDIAYNALRFGRDYRRSAYEIRQIENGVWTPDNNPLKNAPHSQADIIDAEWKHPYSRQQAVFPLSWVAANKFWPSVNRIDDVYGDRNLNCACPPMEAYES